jgi:hypothetical protein
MLDSNVEGFRGRPGRHLLHPPDAGAVMKDYSDPTTWVEFLKEHGIKSEAPPPTKNIFEGLIREPELLISCLKTYADFRDRSSRTDQITREFFAIEGLINPL